MKFLLYEVNAEFVLKKEKDSGEAKFASVLAAIEHIQSTPDGPGATLVVFGADGKPRLQMRL